MPEYELRLRFTAADTYQAERLAYEWADTCAAEYGTRYAGCQPVIRWATRCAYCNTAAGGSEPCCADCRADKHAHCPSWPSCTRENYGRDCDATRMAPSTPTPPVAPADNSAGSGEQKPRRTLADDVAAGLYDEPAP